MSPLQRSLKYLRDQGWTVEKCETWNPYSKTRHDLFNAFDLVALHASYVGVLGIQVTSGSNVAARVKKLEETPVMPLWKQCGNRAHVHGWRKTGPRGKAKHWTVRVVAV